VLIDFEFFGGYANVQFKYHVDTDELPKEVSEELLRLIDSSGIFEIQQSEVTPTSAGPPDVFLYKLSLYDDGRRISLSLNDVTATENIHPLLALLRRLAIEQASKGR